MDINNLIAYLGKKFETLHDSMLYPKGTILEIKSIDIRKFDDGIRTRFRCIKNNDKTKIDAYLDAYEFVGWIGYAIKEII